MGRHRHRGSGTRLGKAEQVARVRNASGRRLPADCSFAVSDPIAPAFPRLILRSDVQGVESLRVAGETGLERLLLVGVRRPPSKLARKRPSSSANRSPWSRNTLHGCDSAAFVCADSIYWWRPCDARRGLVSEQNPKSYRTTTVALSTTGRAKPARCNSAPSSRTSTNGATRGEEFRLRSRSRRRWLRVAPTNCLRRQASRETSHPASGAANLDQGSRQVVDNCSASADTTRPSDALANGNTLVRRYSQGRPAVGGGRVNRGRHDRPTFPLAASTWRTASVGVPRSTATSN